MLMVQSTDYILAKATLFKYFILKNKTKTFFGQVFMKQQGFP